MPSYLATVDKIKSIGNITRVGDDKISPHLPIAQFDVLDIIGQDKYNQILNSSQTETDYINIQLAECYFALSYIIPAINNETSGSGITKATGVGDGRKENLNETDINTIIERYRDNAIKILSKYQKEIDNDEDEKQDLVNTSKIKMISL